MKASQCTDAQKAFILAASSIFRAALGVPVYDNYPIAIAGGTSLQSTQASNIFCNEATLRGPKRLRKRH